MGAPRLKDSHPGRRPRKTSTRIKFSFAPSAKPSAFSARLVLRISFYREIARVKIDHRNKRFEACKLNHTS